jgi:hypothetical protein
LYQQQQQQGFNTVLVQLLHKLVQLRTAGAVCIIAD